MIRQNPTRVDPKRHNVVGHRNKPASAEASSSSPHPTSLTNNGDTYPHRLSFYAAPPTADITLEEFEQWAIDRLRVLAELEACSFRNRSPDETEAHMKPIVDKYLPLNSSPSPGSLPAPTLLPLLNRQRRKDHYSHFILRLAFAQTEDLQQRFASAETALFRLRLAVDDSRERADFVDGLRLGWGRVADDERARHRRQLASVWAANYGKKNAAVLADKDDWCKVDWERVHDLVRHRRVFVRAGKAYVPSKEQNSMVVAEFKARLERELERTARALPRLDEEDRLTPILNHLSKSFSTPDAGYAAGTTGVVDGSEMTARNMDRLARHFPMCMASLHRTLRRDAHLKHFGRLQYTLFLKGIGLSLDECLVFWRAGFRKITEDTFNKEYRYNVRHAYGDVGGDSNRRGGGYSPFSCQKILTEHPPGPGETHGCPYRHFGDENLALLLQAAGVTDRSVLGGVKEDREKQKFHLACNRVFEHLHKTQLKRARDEGIMAGAELETIVHPNEYFKRSYILTNLDKKRGGEDDDGATRA